MKTNYIKQLLVTATLFTCMLQGFSQISGTRIDVQGAYFSDQMWVFSVPTCTRYFDNGWDGYKMLGTSQAPQIYAVEPDGNYQVDAVPNFNDTYISFIAGVDTSYTLTFTNQDLALGYQTLYLIDSVANKTVDIFTTGTQYSFTASNLTPIKRFKIVTTLPVVVVPTPVVTPDPVVTVTPVTPTPVVTPTPTPDPVVVPVTPPTVNTDSKKPKEDKDDKDKKDKKLKIYNSNKIIIVENPGKKGKMKICNATTGKTLKNVEFNENAKTTIIADVPSGTYILNGTTNTESVSTVVMIR